MKRPRRPILIALTTLSLAGVAASCWAAATWVQLVRLQVRISDCCARVEAASGVRLELVANLLHHSKGLDEAEPVERLRHAHGAAVERRLDGSVTGPGTLRRFRQQHAELTSALAEFHGSLTAAAPAGLRIAARDLAGVIDLMEDRLELELEQLERALAAYRTGLRGFPGSLIASAVRLET